MKPHYIRVKNLGSYIEETLDFRDLPSLVAVVGENGAGKSTLFTDAPSFALFNQTRTTTRTGSGIEHMIHTGKDFLEVEFEFSMNDHVYKVVRRRSVHTHELEFWVDGENHSEKITETQAKIRNLIKMDYETMMDTVCIGQGKSSSFMDKKPDERKEVFADVLGLRKYDVLEEEARALRKQTKDEIATVESKLAELGNKATQLPTYKEDVRLGKQEIKQLEAQLTNLEAELEQEITARTQYETKQREQAEHQRRLADCEQSLNGVTHNIQTGVYKRQEFEALATHKDALATEAETLQVSIETLQARTQALSGETGSLHATIEMLTKQAKDLKGKYDRLHDYGEATCELCYQNISHDHKQATLDQLKEEAMQVIAQMKDKRARYDELTDEGTQLTTRLNGARARLRVVREELEKCYKAESALAAIDAKLVELEKQKEQYEVELNKLKGIQVEDLEYKTFNVNPLREQIATLRSQLGAWQGRVAVAERALEQLSTAMEEVSTLETKLAELHVAVDEYDDLVKAFGKSGIQAIIIENNLTEIQSEINGVLALLTDSKVEIEFRTQREKKTKSKKDAGAIETLDILVQDEHGTRIYETYSGGEKFRVDFACHVGLALFLARRAGAQIKFFVVDEGIGSQDTAAKNLLYRCVSNLTRIFDNVIVISHIDDFVEEFDHRVLIHKDGRNGSKVKQIS